MILGSFSYKQRKPLKKNICKVENCCPCLKESFCNIECTWSVGTMFLLTDEEFINKYLWVSLNNDNIQDGIIKYLNIYDYKPRQLQSMEILFFSFFRSY